MQCGPVQTPYGLWNNLRPVLQTTMEQIQGLLNPKVWAPFGPRTTHYGPKIDGSPSLKDQHAHLSPTASILPHTGPTIIKKSYKPVARSSAQSDQGFCHALHIGKQVHKASSYEQRRLIKHAISVLSYTGSHITFVTYFHNNTVKHFIFACSLFREFVI